MINALIPLLSLTAALLRTSEILKPSHCAACYLITLAFGDLRPSRALAILITNSTNYLRNNAQTANFKSKAHKVLARQKSMQGASSAACKIREPPRGVWRASSP